MLNPKNGPEKELSEEACELEAAAVLPVSCLRHLDSSNWKERISCLETFEKAVEVMEKNQIPCQALVRLLDKHPGWKETKLQVMQKKLHIVTLIAQRGNFSKTSALLVLGNLVDKIGDVICSSDTKEALTAVAEACGLPWTAQKVTEAAFSQDSPRTHSETLNWLSSVIKDFGFDGMEAKVFVGYIKSALTAAHPDVRASAFNLLEVMYLYIGAPLRTFFEDQKPSLLSQIDAVFKKMHGQRPPSPSRGRCKFCRDERDEKRGGDAQSCRRNDTSDISRKISAELMLKMQNESWKIRKEGLEEVVRILGDATTIRPTIGDLPMALKACLYDSNKAVVKQTLIVLQQLARLMGPGIKHHVKALGMPMIAVLRDNKSNLRALAFTTLEAWAEQTSMKEWLEGEDFSKEHFFQRQGILGWLAEKLPSTSSISTDLFRCVPHLYSTMENRHEEMRLAAHEALPFFLLHLGFEKMSEAAEKLKPSSRDKLLLVLEKAKAGHPVKPTITFAKPLSKIPKSKSRSKSSSTLIKQCSLASLPTENSESSELNLEVKKVKSEGSVQNTKRPSSVRLPSKPNPKEDNSQMGPIFIVIPKAKEQRVKDEKALKVLRWNFSTPSSKYVEQLKSQMCGCLASWLQEELFHSNFQHHIKALTVMNKHLENEKGGVISCLDLILKWLSLRLFDTNTWVLMKTLEYLRRLFSLLIEEKYQLTENEASSFFPYLLLKMGVTKESILKEVRAIVKQITLVYPVSRIFYFLLEGAQAKNPNQRVGCLKELGWLLKAYGPGVCQPNPSKALKTIITLTGDSSNAVHSAALKVIATARDVYGVETFRTIGNISEKHMSLLEERMKEAAIKQGNLGVKAGPGEGSKRNPRSNNHTEEDYSGPLLNQVEVKDADHTAFGKVPQPPVAVPHGTNLDSPAESSISTSNINMIICHVASGNISTSIEALVQIKEILRQEDNEKVMSGHINQFLIATIRQLKFIHHLQVTAEKRMGEEQVIELYSCVLCNVVCLFQVGSLAQEASAGVLKDLVSTLISLLLDSPADEFQKGQEAIQSVNLLINKVLEKSDPTTILKTLLILLRESLTGSTSLIGFSEMVAKCLWKATRLLPQTIHNISLDQILLEIHNFMKAVPRENLKQYESTYPHRALKTLLHTLCKLKGMEILDHLTLIDNRDESELETHLWKVVKHLAEQPSMNGDKDSSCPNESENCALAVLFKKISNKETARAGLEELYEYRKEHPEADLEPFLKRCSLLFQSYVKQGLAVIESERERASRGTAF